MENTDIEKELAHQREMLRVRRERRNILEIQAAQAGSFSRPETLMEIAALNAEIERHEAEIARLATQAAEDKFSLSEAEYRVSLAEAWDSAQGTPSIANRARLELMRLRLGISPERAQALEYEVRTQLATEVFTNIDLNPILGIQQNISLEYLSGGMNVTIRPESGGNVQIENLSVIQQAQIFNPVELTMRSIGRAIRLHKETALQLLLICLPEQPVLQIDAFASQLLTMNRVAVYPRERELFDSFVTALAAAIAQRNQDGDSDINP
jgi:hypothetical protein